MSHNEPPTFQLLSSDNLFAPMQFLDHTAHYNYSQHFKHFSFKYNHPLQKNMEKNSPIQPMCNPNLQPTGSWNRDPLASLSRDPRWFFFARTFQLPAVPPLTSLGKDFQACLGVSSETFTKVSTKKWTNVSKSGAGLRIQNPRKSK